LTNDFQRVDIRFSAMSVRAMTPGNFVDRVLHLFTTYRI